MLLSNLLPAHLLSTLCRVPSSMPSTSVMCSTGHRSSTCDVIMLSIKHLCAKPWPLEQHHNHSAHRHSVLTETENYDPTTAFRKLPNLEWRSWLLLFHFENILTAIALLSKKEVVFLTRHGRCLNGSVLDWLQICPFLLQSYFVWFDNNLKYWNYIAHSVQ